MFLFIFFTAGDEKFNSIYSFATKYCSWKCKGDKVVPIYDSYLQGMLKAYYAFKKLGKLPKIKIEKGDLDGKGYQEYIKCIVNMKKIEKCFYMQICQLWI